MRGRERGEEEEGEEEGGRGGRGRRREREGGEERMVKEYSAPAVSRQVSHQFQQGSRASCSLQHSGAVGLLATFGRGGVWEGGGECGRSGGSVGGRREVWEEWGKCGREEEKKEEEERKEGGRKREGGTMTTV